MSAAPKLFYKGDGDERVGRVDLLPGLGARAPRSCACGCGDEFIPGRSDQIYKDDHRVKAHKRAKKAAEAEEKGSDVIRGLLNHMGGEEECWEIRAKRWCRCNGSHLRSYDEDGDPICEKCGGPLQGPREGVYAITAVAPEVRAAMREDNAGPSRESLAEEWANAWRPGQRPTTGVDTRCKVYKGEPFKPSGLVKLERVAS